jgi:hypothetical protein
MVQPFRHCEEVRLASEHEPSGAQSVEVVKSDGPVQQLRHTATGGGAVHVPNRTIPDEVD